MAITPRDPARMDGPACLRPRIPEPQHGPAPAMSLRALPALAAVLFLAACGADQTWAPQEQVDAARYVAGPPTTLTMYTTINTDNGSGAHAALLINASQRVLFDPAGTWEHPAVPVQHDVHYGMTDRMVLFYLDYQTRDNFDVIERTIVVPPEIAEMVLRKAQANGAVPKAMCANSIANLLQGIPGFESIRSTMFPIKLGNEFGKIPGVRERYLEEEDVPHTHGVIMVDKDGKPVT